MMKQESSVFPGLYPLGGLMAGAALAALLTALIRLLPLGDLTWVPALLLYAGLMTAGWRLGKSRAEPVHPCAASGASSGEDACGALA